MCGSPSSECLCPTWCFSWIFTGGWLQLKSLGPYVTVGCKGVRSEAMQCPRSVALQDSPFLRGYFHRLTSSAFAASAFLATAVSSDLPFGGTELADCTETEFILPFWLRYANGRLLCCQLFICVWPLISTHDKGTPTRDVVGDADLAEKSRPTNEGTNCWNKHSPSISLKSWTRSPQKCFGTA